MPARAADLVLALVAVGLALALAELAARVLRPVPSASSPAWNGFDGQLRRGLFEADPVLGYRPGPLWGERGRFGFRNGAEYDGTQEPATDVVVLGDSLIQEGELVAALQHELAGTDTRVWNAGIGGYNTLQEAGYLGVTKAFRQNKPLTTCSLTAAGRKAFTQYIDLLEQIVKQNRP